MKGKRLPVLLAVLACLLMTGCGIWELPEKAVRRLDDCFRAGVMCAWEAKSRGKEERDYRIYSTGYYTFPLPLGWVERGRPGEDTYVYPKSGDTGCCDSYISFRDMEQRETVDMRDMMKNKRKTELFLSSLLEGHIVRMKMKRIHTGGTDNEMLVMMKVRKDGRLWNCQIYMTGRGRHLYVIEAGKRTGSGEDVFAIAGRIARGGLFFS